MADNRLPDALEDYRRILAAGINVVGPLALAGTCHRIEQIRCMAISNYDTYDSATVMFDVMGFGKPLDDLPIRLQPGVLSLAWGSEVRQLAAAGPGRRLVPG